MHPGKLIFSDVYVRTAYKELSKFRPQNEHIKFGIENLEKTKIKMKKEKTKSKLKNENLKMKNKKEKIENRKEKIENTSS